MDWRGRSLLGHQSPGTYVTRQVQTQWPRVTNWAPFRKYAGFLVVFRTHLHPDPNDTVSNCLLHVFPGLYPTLQSTCLAIDGSAKHRYELLTGQCDHVIHAQLQGFDNYKAGEQRRAMLDIVVLSRVSINFERC